MKIKYLENVAIGAFGGVLFATATYLLLSSSYAEQWSRHFAYGITALVSLFSAGLAVFGILMNIDHQREQEVLRRERSLAAAKSTLPLTLSKMVSICQRGIELSLNIRSTGRATTDLLAEVSVGEEFLKTLKDCIEFADEESGDRIAGIIRTYQVLNARLSSQLSSTHLVTDQNRAHEAVNWAILLHRVEDAFEYSRNEVDAIPAGLSDSNTRSIFTVRLMLTLDDHPFLEDQIARTSHMNDPELL